METDTLTVPASGHLASKRGRKVRIPRHAGGRLEFVGGCVACELSAGVRELPGGLIHNTRFWRVEHCIGPLGLGTLIVKPSRHVTAVASLSGGEAAELGPLLQRASAVAGELVGAEQVYNCLWSHAGGRPVHIHYVVQPVTKEQLLAHGAHGPKLQVSMFSNREFPDASDVERIAERARAVFAR